MGDKESPTFDEGIPSDLVNTNRIAESYNSAIYALEKKDKVDEGGFDNAFYRYIQDSLLQPFLVWDESWQSTLDGIKWYYNVTQRLNEKLFEGKDLYEIIKNWLKKELKIRDFSFNNIKSFENRRWFLIIWLDNGENLIFNLLTHNIEDLYVNNSSKEYRDKLKEEMSLIKWITFWWAVIGLLYEPIIEWVDTIEKKFRLKELKFTQDWYEIVKKIDGIEMLTSRQITETLKNNSEVVRLMENAWCRYSITRGQFELKDSLSRLEWNIDALKYADMKRALKKYSYEDYIKEMKEQWKEVVSIKDFKKIKKEGHIFLDELNKEFNVNSKKSFWRVLRGKFMSEFFATWNWWKAIISNSLHAIMMPIFFTEIHKNPWNWDAILEWWVEYLLFTQWAKYWSKVPGPWIVRMAWWLVFWILATWAWAQTLHYFDKFLLSCFPDREDYLRKVFNKDSFSVDTFSHIVSLWFINDFADLINTDIWFYKTNLTPFANNINFWTDIISYMNQRISWVSHWNKEVDEFTQKALKLLQTEIFDKEYKYSDVLEWEETIEWWDIFEDSFTKKVTNLLIASQDWEWIFSNIESKLENDAKKIYKFTKKNIPEDLLLWELNDPNDRNKWYKIDAFIARLEEFIISENILTKEDALIFIVHFKDLFYVKMNKQIDSILWNPNLIEGVLWSSSSIHNSVLDTKIYLRNSIRDSYVKERTVNENPAKKPWEQRVLSICEAIVQENIQRLKIDDQFILQYKKGLVDDERLINLALDWKLDRENIQTDNWVSIIVLENGEELVITWMINDLLYISSLIKSGGQQSWDEDFIKYIFHRILHPEEWFMINWDYEDNDWNIIDSSNGNWTINKQTFRHYEEYDRKKAKFQELLRNDQFYLFFNRMLDYKRRKVFINNVEINWDSSEINWWNDVIYITRKKILEILQTPMPNEEFFVWV